MGRSSLSWDECWPVIESESRRYAKLGDQIGLDHDDLRQEATMAAVQCLAKWRPEGGGRAAYVRRAVRNRFEDVRRRALREMRTPHDEKGRPQPAWLLSYEALIEDNGGFAGGSNHDRIESRSLLRMLHDRLPPDDWEFLVQTLVHGAHLVRGLAPATRRQMHDRLARVREDARRILNRALHFQPVTEDLMTAVPNPATEDLPECHAKGEQPQGYDREDGVCWNCRDKFTCLPEAIERSLIVGAVSDDREVEAVLAGTMTFRMAIERMRTRLSIMDRGGAVPDDLLVSAPIEATRTQRRPSAPPVAPEPAVEAAKLAVETPVAPEPAPRKAQVSKRKKIDARKLVDAQGRPTMKNGKPLPPVRDNTPEQMQAALRRVKIGQPFELKVGMQLVRKIKDGDHVIVRIKPRGFELDGVIYSSLSTAIMYRLRKMQSGNAYFHLDHLCTEIWAEDGTVLAGHSTQ